MYIELETSGIHESQHQVLSNIHPKVSVEGLARLLVVDKALLVKDGLTPACFKQYWDIIGDNIFEEFFSTGYILNLYHKD